MKRGGGSVPFHPDHPEDSLGFARGGRRGSPQSCRRDEVSFSRKSVR